MDWYQRAHSAKGSRSTSARGDGSADVMKRNSALVKRPLRWLTSRGSQSSRGAHEGPQEYWAERSGSATPSKMGSRPASVASTRCPSSASTMRRSASPTSVCPSPFGDPVYATFGGKSPFNRNRSPMSAASEAWTNVGIPDGGDGQNSPEDRSMSPPPREPEEEVAIPDWYRPEGSSTIGVALLPDYDLWISLKGGNGNWDQRKALVEWRYQLAEHSVSEEQRISELQRARKAKIEADMKRRADREELQRRVEEDAIERKRRMIAEEERLLRLRLEEEDQKRVLAEKKERMHKSRPCKVCNGSGKCIPCAGKGCTLTLYLAPVVNERTKSICGQLPKGCFSCGGSGDGAWWGEFVCGSGACQGCGGKCMVPAPPNGWPDCQ